MLPAKKLLQKQAVVSVNYFIVFGFILILGLFQGCKKDNNDTGAGFTGCRLIKFNGEAVTYRADHRIARIGDIYFNYAPGKVVMYDPYQPTFAIEVFLNSKNKCEKIKMYTPDDPDYSIEYSYTYDDTDQPIKCKFTETVNSDSITYELYYILLWENQNLIKVQVKWKENGPVQSEQILEYGFSLDTRKDFFQLFYFNQIGNMNIPFGNNCSKNLLKRINYSIDYSYQFDSKGNVTAEIVGNGSADTTRYEYECH